MVQFLPYIQIILSILLIVGILLQRSEAGLGSAFGGDSATGSRFGRRGMEKVLFNTTIVVGVLFVLSCFASLFLGR